MHTMRIARRLALAAAAFCQAFSAAGALDDEFLVVSNGYFHGRTSGQPMVPRGFSYQVFNPAVYATQDLNQVRYDLGEMKALRANSLRVEFVWGEVETSEGNYDWARTDALVALAEAYGIKLFVLVGYQYPPAWFASGHPDRMGVHYDPVTAGTGTSVVLNYSHPDARDAYADFIGAVAHRYRNSPAIAAWIVGNEFAFYDLWEDPNTWANHRYLGFDAAHSLPSFRAYLQGVYGDIGSLNAVWGTGHAGFDDIPMPLYPGDRADAAAIRQSGYHDVLQWRKRVIGDFVGAGAAAARAADTNHLVTYSMVGAIFNGLDANHTCEDARVIVERCAAAGAPLDFWSINNYPWTLTGSEMRSVDFGIRKYRDTVGLPVLITETGLSSTDSLFTETPARYAQALPSLLWESLLSGAMGVHLFHWNDRDAFLASGAPLDREAGFGIVQGNRLIKSPAYWNVMLALLRMDDVQVDRLLAGSADPQADVAVYAGVDADLGFHRMNQELGMTWAAFRRLGLQPRLLTETAFDAGAWTSAPALYLPRSYQLEPGRLDALETLLIATGVHVHAGGDLPGQFDTHHRANTNWASRMASLFGVGVGSAVAAWDAGSTNLGGWPADYQNVDVYIQSNVAPLVQSAQPLHFGTWKIWHGVTAVTGLTVATHTGMGGAQPPVPALQFTSHGAGQGKAAVNTFALGDIINFYGDGNVPEHPWRVRRDLLQAVYLTHFGLTPKIQLSGSGAEYVASGYRIASNGSRLVTLLNLSASGVYVNVSAPGLLAGQEVEDLTRGARLAAPSTGSVDVAVGADEFVVLYAYSNSINVAGRSLDQPGPCKVWITDGPMRVWPNDDLYPALVRYDTDGAVQHLRVDLIRAGPTNIRYGASQTFLVQGSGVVTAGVPAQLFTPHDHEYASFAEGARYELRAALIETNGFTDTSGPDDLVGSFEGLSRGTFVAPLPWVNASYGNGSQQYLVDGIGDLATDGTNGAFHVYQSHTTPGGYSGFYMTYTFGAPPVIPDDLGETRFQFDFRETNGHPATLELQIRDTQNQLSTFSKPYVHAASGFDRIEADLSQFTGAADAHSISQLVVLVRMLGTNKTYVGHVDNIRFASGGRVPFAAETRVPVLFHWGLRPDALPETPQLLPGTAYPVAVRWESLPSYLGAEIPTPLDRADVWPGPQNDETEQYRVQLDLLDPNGSVVTSVSHVTSAGSTSHAFNVQTPAVLTHAFYQWRGEIATLGADHDRVDGFEDRALGNLNQTLALPWSGYSYAEQTQPQWLDEGIGTAHVSEGAQSAFRVVWNPTNSGAWAGFGYIYTFPASFSLFDPAVRSSVWFSADFREADGGHPCTLELQVKDQWGNLVRFLKSYAHPGASGFDTIGATLDEFEYNPAMDWLTVREIVVNVRMEQQGVAYAGIFDNIQFTGTPAGGGGYVRGRFYSAPYTTEDAAAAPHYPFRGIAYSPYRDGQGPGWGVYPTTNQIREDLLEVRKLAPKIRSYSTISNLKEIASIAQQVGLDVYPGAWVAVNPTNIVQEPAANGVELTNLIEVAQAGYSHVKGLIVGNEVLYMEQYENPHTTPERRGWLLTNLIAKIEQVKAATGLPVATAEPYLMWTNESYAALRDVVDFCIMHVHPYWNGVSVTGAAEFVLGVYYDTKRVFPDKAVVIGETGWPTEGHPLGRAVPSEDNQLHFLRDFRALADLHGVDYFWFEVYDEAWKFDGSVGPHWGIWNADRTWKAPFAQLMAEESGFRGIRPGGGSAMAVDLDTFAWSEYQLQVSTNLMGGAWSNLTVVTGAGQTNLTSLALTNGAERASYLRLMPIP